MPTWPTLMSCWYLRAAQPLLVKMEVPLPLGLRLMKAMASSSVSTHTTLSTGPKISCW